MLLTTEFPGTGYQLTLAEQRLNSNHGRLVRAARALPPFVRHVPIEGWGWTPRDVLAHVLAWQEEALRRFHDPRARCLDRNEIDAWNEASRQRMEDLRWDEILGRVESAHLALKPYLTGEPPTWFAACTYRHYTEHTRTLRALVQPPTVVLTPLAAEA